MQRLPGFDERFKVTFDLDETPWRSLIHIDSTCPSAINDAIADRQVRWVRILDVDAGAYVYLKHDTFGTFTKGIRDAKTHDHISQSQYIEAWLRAYQPAWESIFRERDSA